MRQPQQPDAKSVSSSAKKHPLTSPAAAPIPRSASQFPPAVWINPSLKKSASLSEKNLFG
jgi:hypothetical protein